MNFSCGLSEDYQVPLRSTGTLNKIVVDLGEAKLSPEDQKELDKEESASEVID